jgi:hypothetical protein
MKTIKVAYEEGLTIPDAAKAIRVAMREASPVRARLIARTELAALAQGGSLAAAKIGAKRPAIRSINAGKWHRARTGPGTNF